MWGLGSRGLLGSGRVWRHLQLPVLRGDIAVLQRDQDGVAVLPGPPLLRLHGGVRAGRVRVQVVLEQVGLGTKATPARREQAGYPVIEEPNNRQFSAGCEKYK